MPGLRLIGLVLLAVAAVGAGSLVFMLQSTPFAFQSVNKPSPALPATPLKALFLGTSTMAWTDGETTWLVDGFFSRQALGQVLFTRLKVDEPVVMAVAGEMFRRLDMPAKLGGILVAHSHYDHALDAPFLTRRFGGRVIGSESTRQIAKGQNLPDSQVLVPFPGSSVQLGNFQVRLVESAHAPTGFTGGFNNKPVSLPSHALAFKEGLSYSFVVSHPDKGEKPFALIQPSAGFRPGQNQGLSVETVFLGTGGLGKLSDDYIAAYWQEMVVNTGARQVYLIHWDDFTQALLSGAQPNRLQPMPRLLDDFPRSLQLLNKFSYRDNVRLEVLDAWEIVDF